MKILLFFGLLLTASAYGQEGYLTVQGSVTDRQSHEPLPYASVYLKGKSIGTTTNGDGKFVFHIPTRFAHDTLVISMIGYGVFASAVQPMIGKENMLSLNPAITTFDDVVIKASKELSAKEIVKKAVAAIPQNYPMKPFVIEGFFRDLQRENNKPVELLEAAVRFRYTDYNPGYEDVEIQEVRRSHNNRHPVNGTYDRQNAIIDLMEDNYVKHRFGPIEMKGWKFRTDSIVSHQGRTVYRVSGSKSANETIMYIDSEDFSILRLELRTRMIDGEFYRRYLNLPDPYGLQETSFTMIFEFQKIDSKLYLKYQCEEDTYNLFNKTTQQIILKQSFVKELFVNHVITDAANQTNASRMNMNKSLESQAKPFNPEFWKYYNAPIETSADSKIVSELEKAEFKKQ